MDRQTKEIKIVLPADVLLSANIDSEHLAREMRESLAYKYFAMGRLSSGKAARLAGMARVEFLLNAHKFNVDWFAYSDDELRRELAEK